MRRGKAFGRGIAWGNRTGLALLGLLLFAAGGAALARGLGVFGADAARQPLLPGFVTAFARSTSWFWPVVAIGGVVLALIGLSWLLALLRLDRLRRIRLESGPSGVTEIGGRQAGEALAGQVSGYQGVRRARATLRGKPDAPALDLRVISQDPANPDALIARLHDEAVPDLRATLGMRRLPALVRLDFTTRKRTREVH
ncbi:alkaline shock response membrane anchor protein AmaP [Microtetraspora sp. AC03309]|uniref:alkaline shock response membrane anchor protein AmaP n=1 Tax=Microtetraspora sp. AC03309 TaxID=2779376 RepID=UPI001E4041B6|nr:alkaline shock response membrane anchor protein AmaP [Microtetraspora sp. AC03309]MCC5579750.1 alkaline shock response membrane anchor protein AmaP [Microtetraspora sp. AC03309]